MLNHKNGVRFGVGEKPPWNIEGHSRLVQSAARLIHPFWLLPVPRLNPARAVERIAACTTK